MLLGRLWRQKRSTSCPVRVQVLTTAAKETDHLGSAGGLKIAVFDTKFALRSVA